MKKNILFLLALLLMLTTLVVFSACKEIHTDIDDTPAAETSPETQPEIPTSEETTVAETAPETQPDESVVTIPDGAFSTDAYTVSQVNGQYYLNFLDGNQINSNDSTSNLTAGSLSFPSLTAMKQAIKTNSFTPSEIQIIKTAFPQDENGITAVNINYLFTSVLPEGYVLGDIQWTGSEYTLNFNGNEASGSGYVRIMDQNTWDSVYQNEMDLLENKKNIQHEIGIWDGVQSETYIYTTSVSKLKKIYLTIPSENASSPTMVIMRYCLEHSDPEQTVSNTLPYSIEIYGENNSQYFKVLFLYPTTAPSVEWLSSFGITPYVEGGDHVAS